MKSCLELVGPPPTIPDSLGTDDHTTDPQCAEKWELCADAEAAGKLVAYVAEAQRFVSDVKTHCAEVADENELGVVASGHDVFLHLRPGDGARAAGD